MIQKFGKNRVVRFEFVKTKEEVISTAKKLIEETTQYDKDGVVITINNSEVENIKLPEKKIAFKFNKQMCETEVLAIEWNTSRTGKIIPIVLVNPVELGGATIQRATGFHAKYIYENEIGPGAIVKLIRSGDVIPYIDSVIKKSTNFETLVACPSCGCIELVTDDTQTHLYCSNINCPAQTQKKIAYFFEKLGLENFSEKMITSLKCNSVLDIYNLKKEDIMKIDGWAETSSADFINRINQTKLAKPEKILAALGIENLGTSTSKLILEHFAPKDILAAIENQELLKNMIEKLIQIKGIGEKKIKTIIIGLKENKELLKKLMALGVSFEQQTGPLTGKKFCITGALTKPRKAYEQIIEKFGGTNTSISSCDYLIYNTPTLTGKFKKAMEKGITIINEQQFVELVKANK